MEEIKLELEAKEASAAFTDNQAQYDRIVPCLNEAIDSMQTIAKNDVEELRGLNTPPKVIKLIMKAICMVLDIEPILARKKDGSYKKSYWKTAISNQSSSNSFYKTRPSSLQE
jgi:dynein heavy chain, axonemal